MSHSGKIITAPIDIEKDLGAVFGTGSGDLDTNYDEGNINKWARYKPVQYNKRKILTDSERASVNHGFVVTPGNDSILEYSLENLFARYTANAGEYIYKRPTTWKRLLDCLPPSLVGNGYNGDAPAPFVYNNPSRDTTYRKNYTLNVTLNSAAAAELTIADIIGNNSYQADMTKWYICLACRYTKNGAYNYKLARAMTTDGADTPRTLAAFVKGEMLYAEIELDGFRTYEMIWVATELDPANPTDAGACVYLPLGGFSFTLNQTSLTVNYTFYWSGGGPIGASQNAYDRRGDYVPCAAIDFGSAFSNVRFASASPESRTATIYSTPRVHLLNGDIIACDQIRISTAGAVSVNTTSLQTIDTTLVGTVLCTTGGENIAAADVSYIELITQVEIDAGGDYIIVLANSAGDQIDTLYIY